MVVTQRNFEVFNYTLPTFTHQKIYQNSDHSNCFQVLRTLYKITTLHLFEVKIICKFHNVSLTSITITYSLLSTTVNTKAVTTHSELA